MFDIQSPSNIRQGSTFPVDTSIHNTLKVFAQERYVLWYTWGGRSRPVNITIALKEGHTSVDHLKAWVHAVEIAGMCGGRHEVEKFKGESDERVALIRKAYATVEETFSVFVEDMRSLGWRIDEGAIITGSPSTIVVDQTEENASRGEK